MGVMRRPVAVALASSALLLAAALPLLSTTLTGPSAELVPPGQPSRDVNERIEASYGRGVTEAISVTVHGEISDAQLARLDARIGAIDGIDGATLFVRASDDTAYANFAPANAALSGASQDAVDQIRALPVGDSARLLVSGNTARFIDEKQSLLDHLGPVVAMVAGTTLVLLLFMLTGSIILPLKTLIMNALTLAATLGIIVLAFQEGWLKGPLDYTGPAAIEVATLAFLLAILFGLATDYAVLVMARIKEQHDQGAPNEQAVATGIGHTGRVITAAAVMIAVVLGAFAVSPVFFMKQVAVGQAVGCADRRDHRARTARPRADAAVRRVELVGASAAEAHPPALRVPGRLRRQSGSSPRPREAGPDWASKPSSRTRRSTDAASARRPDRSSDARLARRSQPRGRETLAATGSVQLPSERAFL